MKKQVLKSTKKKVPFFVCTLTVWTPKKIQGASQARSKPIQISMAELSANIVNCLKLQYKCFTGFKIRFWVIFISLQKQPCSGVLRKRCSENMQQIYRKTLMSKCDLAWMFSCKFAAYFLNTFSQEHLCRAAFFFGFSQEIMYYNCIYCFNEADDHQSMLSLTVKTSKLFSNFDCSIMATNISFWVSKSCTAAT